MTAPTRLDLVSHGITEALRTARFPADEPLTAAGRAALVPLARPPAVQRSAPETRAAQTAAALGLAAVPDPALRDLDAGRWRGRELGELPPDEVGRWLTDPKFDGHGGESVVALFARTEAWLAAVAAAGEAVIAITHPAVVRACVAVALGAPPAAFWRIDVPPGSRTRLHHRGAWTLRLPA